MNFWCEQRGIFFFVIFFIPRYKFHDVQYVARHLMWLPGVHLNKLYLHLLIT